MDSAGALIDLIAFFTQAVKRIHVARHGAPAVLYLKKLASDSFEEREKSTRALIELGPAVLEDLARAEAASDDPEVKIRCQSIRRAIQKPNLTALAAPARNGIPRAA